MREKVLQKEASTLWNEGWLPVPRHAAVQKWLLPCFGKKRRWRPLGYLPFFSQGYQKVLRGHLTGEACSWGQESMLSSLIHIYVLCRIFLLQLLFFKVPSSLGAWEDSALAQCWRQSRPAPLWEFCWPHDGPNLFLISTAMFSSGLLQSMGVSIHISSLTFVSALWSLSP